MRKINSRVGLCIGLLTVHALSSCTSIKQGIGTKKLKKPMQTMLGAALFSNVMGTPIPTNMPSLSNATGLSNSTAMGTTLNPYDLSTTEAFNASEVHPYACKDAMMGIDMLNAKRGPYGMTLLMDAAAGGRIEELEQLIRNKADLNVQDNNGRTALMYAIANDKIDVVKILTENNLLTDSTADSKIELLNAGDKEGITPLMRAIINNKVQTIKYLLKNQHVNLNAKDHEGKTALMYGAIGLEPDIYKLLVESNRINLNAQDHEGKTALMYAIMHQKKENAELLINYGAFMSLGDYEGKTALMHVVISNMPKQKDFVNFLIDKGASMDVQDASGRTALMHAAIHDSVDSIAPLLDKGADMNIKDHKGLTFLMHHIINFPDLDKQPILNLLQNRRFNLEEQDHEGKTALMYTAIHGKLLYASVLIKEKADLHAKDHDKMTPYAHAIRSGQFGIAEFLEKHGADPNE
ncbi:ankyrin repeat domain-containing protein [Candidatus Cardinium hertigii]|uniref:ankyrin repeat domain-containing protein n=1 Tax=Candidatus Cardinium hertigii TaxID=247481 RepID=UPI003D7C83C0